MMLFTVILAASELHLFDMLQEARDISEICRKNSPHEVIEILCEILCSSGILTKEADGRYKNSEMASVYLRSTSPYFQKAYLENNRKVLFDIWFPLAGRIMAGPVSYSREHYFKDLSLPSMAENAICGRLQDVLYEITSLEGFSNCRKTLDLGGGHGLYAIALALKNPRMTCVIQDLPLVIPFAEEYIARYGVAGRVTTLPGDFFTDSIGSGYDIIFSSSNPGGRRPDMVQKITDALRPGGYFITVQSRGGEQENLFSRLEWLLWNFSDDDKGSRDWKGRVPFPDEKYLTALSDAGLVLLREREISDPYKKGHSVIILITRKHFSTG
ncbi:MAG: hypothetical protein JXA44_00820 [Methanospirillaceae archaeon]|nr:hypothetical protein [Methanospirillaceae archaeon]